MIRFRPVLHVLTLLIAIIALFMLAPLGIALADGDTATARAFLLTIGPILLICTALWWISRSSKGMHQLRPREGFLLVSSSWIIASAVGAVPFVLSGSIPHYTDAFFETMSGFTTTGSSILSNIEILPRAILFWRSLTHWLGGMGIVVLTVAILPFLGVGGVPLFRAESPGPTLDKIAPQITQTAKILWFIYLSLTLLETLLLMLVGMNFFDALTHTFGTLATGGFSPRNASIAAYQSPYIDVIITIFMLIAGLNFGLLHQAILGKSRQIFGNIEFKTYLFIFIIATIFITIPLINYYGNLGSALRYASFQTASILTTTGYASADFDLWPSASKGILFFLMFVGGCAGSTGGGPKVIRLVALFKLALNEMRYMAQPRGLFKIRLNREVQKKNYVYPVAGFLFLYIACLLIVTLIVSAFGTDLLSSFSTALVSIGNIGPGFSLVGPTQNYAFYHPFVKWILSAAMLAGRLEVYTLLILLTPSFWSRH